MLTRINSLILLQCKDILKYKFQDISEILN